MLALFIVFFFQHRLNLSEQSSPPLFLLSHVLVPLDRALDLRPADGADGELGRAPAAQPGVAARLDHDGGLAVEAEHARVVVDALAGQQLKFDVSGIKKFQHQN